jgi:hypothetical protein
VAEALHVPPDVIIVAVAAAPSQTEGNNEMPAGTGFTIKEKVLKQPDGIM